MKPMQLHAHVEHIHCWNDNWKKQTKGISYDIDPVSGSSAGSREKRSHNRMIDSHWAWKHIALK